MRQLTITRYCAALVVVFFHFGRGLDTGIPAINRALEHGPAMVSYFFVLSGFILTTVYAVRTAPFDRRGFYAARFARIVPVYLLALLFTVIVLLPAAEPIPIAQLVLQASLTHAWLPGNVAYLNYPSWSLSVEALFYLVFPFILPYMARSSAKRLFAMTGLLWGVTWLMCEVAARHWQSTPALMEFWNYNPLFHLNAFVFGIAGGIWMGRRLPGGRIGASATIAWVLAVALVGALLTLHEPLTRLTGLALPFNRGLLAPLFLVIVLGLALDESVVSRLLAVPALVLLGEASYAVYLLQVPARHLFVRIASEVPFRSEWIAFGAYLVVLTVLGIVVLVTFERPLRSYLRQRLHGSPPLVTAERPG